MFGVLFIKELRLTNITWQMNPNWLAYEHLCGLKTGLRTINKRTNAINLSSWNRHSTGGTASRERNRHSLLLRDAVRQQRPH